MARFNEILSGRFNRALQKLTSMKGPPPAAQLASEISVNLQFNQMGVDFRYLEAWEKFAIVFGQVPQAGQFGVFRLRNPAGSNVIAVFESIAYSSALVDAALLLQLQTTNADMSVISLSPRASLDNRTRQLPTLIASRNDAVTAAVSLGNRQGRAIAANTSVEFILNDDQQIPLLPGDAIQLQAGVANQQFNSSFVWRERFLEDSERT